MQTREGQWERFQHQHGEYLTHGPDKNGETALHKAASGGYEHVAEDLIKQGHDINAKNCFGESVMQVAIAPLREPQSDPRGIQQALIDAGVDLHAKDNTGHSLLHSAAMTGDPEMCKFLVERGGLDINARTLSGDTPLHSAAKLGRAECIGQLLKNGAEASIQNVDHKSARDVALGVAAKDTLDKHAFEQRMKCVQLPDPQSALQRLGSQTREPDLTVKARKL